MYLDERPGSVYLDRVDQGLCKGLGSGVVSVLESGLFGSKTSTLPLILAVRKGVLGVTGVTGVMGAQGVIVPDCESGGLLWLGIFISCCMRRRPAGDHGPTIFGHVAGFPASNLAGSG